MRTRLWLATVVMAGLLTAPQHLRAEEHSKAAQYRAEAKKLLQAAEDLERKDKLDKVDKEEKKPKVDKEAGIKKTEKERDDDGDKKPTVKKGDHDDGDKKPVVKKGDHDHGDKKPVVKKGDRDDEDKKPDPKKKEIADGDKKPEPKKVDKAALPHVKGALELKGSPGTKEPLMFKMLIDGDKGVDGKGPHEARVIMLKSAEGPQMGGMPGMGKGPGSDLEQKLSHMTQAARHLREAGAKDMAENVERAAGEVKRQMAEQRERGGAGGPGTGELRQVIEQLRKEVAELRESVRRMQPEGGKR